ncbi:MAG: DUF5333 family protein [Pseudomonadota bacterium]
MGRAAYVLCFLAGPCVVGASSAAAETQAPDYYIEALFAVSTAETLTEFCPDVGFDPGAANAQAEAVLNQLAADGITGDAILALTGIEAGVAALQSAFTQRYALTSPTEDAICAAAQAEMSADSAIGRVLVEEGQ